MRCYTGQHRFYAGVDLHARSMFTGSAAADWVDDHPVARAVVFLGGVCVLTVVAPTGVAIGLEFPAAARGPFAGGSFYRPDRGSLSGAARS